MGIFRRHTDEVFSTLQQVQRRISSQGGNPPKARPSTEEEIARVITPEPPSVEDAPRPASEPVERPHLANPAGPASYPGRAHPAGGPVPATGPATGPAPATSPSASGDPGAASPSGAPAHTSAFPAQDPSVPRRGITLSPEAIGTLLCLWIFTVVGAYMLGGSGAAPSGGEPEPPAQSAAVLDGDGEEGASRRRVELPDERDLGTVGRAAPAVDHTPGDHILILQSSADAKQATRKHFEKLTADYNRSAAMAENRRRGLKPLFGVRYPSGGGIQFVFGARGEGFGIPKDDTLAKNMEKILKDTFGDAFWLKVR